jgi:phosphate/sulfate permease
MLNGSVWLVFLTGYLLSVLIEMPILLVGLSVRHPPARRWFAGFWLTGCTYPVMFLVLPPLLGPLCPRGLYLVVAETIAPVAECLLFWAAFGERKERWRPSMWHDGLAIITANLASFAIGEQLRSVAAG